MPRLIKPDARKICDLCNEKGWGAMELANAAIITVATAGKIIRGEPVFRNSLTKAAKAFGKKYVDLLEGSPPTEDSKEKRIKIQLDFPIGREAFDENRILEIIALLNTLIGGSGDIDMDNIEDGSTILTLTVNEPDLLRLIAALEDRKDEIYRQLGVTDIRIDSAASIVFFEGSLRPGTIRPERNRQSGLRDAATPVSPQPMEPQTEAPKRLSFRVKLLLVNLFIVIAIIIFAIIYYWAR